ncbi:asparagine synthase (glutamine-hydrolyzing) [Vibrio cholerae]|uniref:asparagine synthase (glutamine-hydrolyzing) n=1 Tax=Vibrio cholerae TaxID=666 RepID=UPI0004E3CEFD|nr:asparagine synthase (glutamine-hydrolyzing) [Vibrio cholerae]EGR0413165.1 asparagine synthase (glutamine-hydrolyzing) [Vibrio cholerae]EGR2474993.1 asparagine synthase (glutamine-hydrolyzing) [Vibrio cholerae]EJL6303226.1 asparagine synthase (glutamine-hydrolyzing) [Vibrio cholerae]EKF9273349.1 asparagine synthase (glutamine-hydrolyzing) [Vibrio cholerae]EKF9890361.1 asparagine synthase (glutamine-hydrolyzing) [Vibrio cholerae]
MCGIAGYWQRDCADTSIALSMAEAIVTRGPDDFGVWSERESGIALAHRRLSILDLSPAGHQPMVSGCGRYVLVFNGEIYNHLSLRSHLEEKLKGFSWRGHSDTETLIECFAVWGVEKTIGMAVGMFSFALWDTKDKLLTLARDRLGEKPLYWGWSDDMLIFASEIKAIKAHSGFKAEIDRDSLTLFLRHGYVPAPYSIYRGIQKLMPGHFIEIDLGGDISVSKSANSRAYWSVNEVVNEGLARPFSGSASDAVDILETQLKASVSDQMLSDVPLGAFLSGGIDSSTIVALMQCQSKVPVKTFTIGFDETGYNEAVHAKAVARHIGTDHTELYVQPIDALSVIPKLPHMYCEPFADSSQIPTFLVSQLAKQHVTVALCGDGGDELFGGYNRYMAAQKVWNPLMKMPEFVRILAAAGFNSLSPATWDKVFEHLKPVLPKRYQLSIPGEKARKLGEVLKLKDGAAFYRQLTSHWAEPESLVINGKEPLTQITDNNSWAETDSLEHFMMALDAKTYMSDDILTKVDRAAMACSLETRVPMLDHRVFELAWRMPLGYKVREGQGKWLLRQVLYRYVPKELIERPKMGFGIPLDSWLRGPLKAWAEALLDEQRLRNEGYLNPAPIRQLWNEHLSGKKNWQYHLWNVLMFQAWLEINNA